MPQKVSRPNGEQSTLTYAYDPNGNRTTLTDASGSTTFGYDQLNRLTSAAYPGTYGTWSWTYDQVGNRLTQNSPSGQTNYGYDANNRLTSVGSTTYSYDINGNLTSISTGTTFTYDAHNRLSQANLPGGLVVQYTYDGDGVKIRRIEGSVVTRYYCDGIRPIYETKADGSRNADLERDIFGNLLARQDSGGARYYYHHDGLGSTVGLTNASGQVAAQRTYDAWGNRRTSSGSAPGNYQFTGAELDPTSGLYHMGARFYDPTVGRWLTEDPIQDAFDPSSLNFYAYVENNPMILVDPDGRASMDARLILVGAPSLSILGPVGLVVLAGFAAGIGVSVLKNQRLERHLDRKIHRLDDWFRGLFGQLLPSDFELYRWGKNRQKALDALQGLQNLRQEILSMLRRGGLTQAQRDHLLALLWKIEQLIETLEQALREADAR